MAPRENKIASLSDALKEMADGLNKLAYAPDMNSYKPHAKQEKFHSSEKKMRLYIGGNRSGKTTGGIIEDIWWLTGKHPYISTPQNRPVAGRIISVDFANGVNKIIIPQLKQWVPPSQLRGGSWYSAYDSKERVLNFSNGSFLELMSYDQDLDKFAGTSRDFIHYDEEPPNDIYTECQARLIDRKGRSWITMTPVEGMTWIYDVIYQPGIIGDPRVDVIEVDMAENPYLDEDEIEDYLGSLDEDTRQARGHGKFVQIGGLVYKQFRMKTHVIEPLNIKKYLNPQKYKWYMSLDHGYNNPTAVLWHAVDINNNVITFDEWYMAEKTIDFHAEVIKKRDKEHGRAPDVRICDPALAQRQATTGTSIQTEYAIRGIGMIEGDNDMNTGIAKVNQYLEVDSKGHTHWHITANCVNLIREIQRLRWKTWATKKQQHNNNPYDQIHKKDDHACDSARYFFSFVPELRPNKPPPTKKLEIPQIGGNSAKSPTLPWVDPNLKPGVLGKKTEWQVSLNEEY